MLKRVLLAHFLECCEYQADNQPDKNTASAFVERHFDAFEDAVIDFVGDRFWEEAK